MTGDSRAVKWIQVSFTSTYHHNYPTQPCPNSLASLSCWATLPIIWEPPPLGISFLSLRELSYDWVLTKLNMALSIVCFLAYSSVFEFPLFSQASNSTFLFSFLKDDLAFFLVRMRLSPEFHHLPSLRHQLSSILSIFVVETSLLFLPSWKLMLLCLFPSLWTLWIAPS